MNISNLEKNAEKAADLLKALSNDKRLMVLCMLKEGEQNVGQLEQKIGLSQSALSQHLARLRKDGLVNTRRDAQTIYYSLENRDVVQIMECLHNIFCDDA